MLEGLLYLALLLLILLLGDRQVKAYPRTRLYLPNQAEKDRIRDRSSEAGNPEGVAEQ